MDVATIYSLRTAPRAPLSDAIQTIISKLKISFKPIFRRPFVKPRREEPANWRESALQVVFRKVREKDDPEYHEINACINKLTKQTYAKLIAQVLEKLEKQDEVFRLRVTTLLFDRGLSQNFYASIMADAYADIAKVYPEARGDLLTQVSMFDTLYDVGNVTVIPSSEDPGFNDAIIAWTKQKEKKRGFAVYVAELYSRGLIPEDTMASFVSQVLDDLKDSVKSPKTSAKEEHVDALIRFLFAVKGKVPTLKDAVKALIATPKTETPNLNMKSRFKLEDILA
jgi:hypothetical protein